jgi:hypothetical protein
VAWLPGACNTPFLRMNKCVVPGLGRVRLPSEGNGHTFESYREQAISRTKDQRMGGDDLRQAAGHPV